MVAAEGPPLLLAVALPSKKPGTPAVAAAGGPMQTAVVAAAVGPMATAAVVVEEAHLVAAVEAARQRC